MRDFGDGALLAAEEIEKERGVILSEKISRDSVGTRLMEQQFAKILPDSLVTRRFPIGTEEVIKSAPRERFTDLYTRFYTPAAHDLHRRRRHRSQGNGKHHQGDFRIHDQPGRSREKSGSRPHQAAGRHRGRRLRRQGTQPPPTSRSPWSAPISRSPTPPPPAPSTRTLDIAHSIISRRFDRLSKIEGSAIASGSASNNNLFNYIELGSIDVTAADDRWQEAVPVMEQEFRRAMDHGFTEAELAEAKSNLLNAYEQQVKQKATRKSDSIATVLARSINDNTVFSDPATDLELARNALDSIDAKSCPRGVQEILGRPRLPPHPDRQGKTGKRGKRTRRAL